MVIPTEKLMRKDHHRSTMIFKPADFLYSRTNEETDQHSQPTPGTGAPLQESILADTQVMAQAHLWLLEAALAQFLDWTSWVGLQHTPWSQARLSCNCSHSYPFPNSLLWDASCCDCFSWMYLFLFFPESTPKSVILNKDGTALKEIKVVLTGWDRSGKKIRLCFKPRHMWPHTPCNHDIKTPKKGD